MILRCTFFRGIFFPPCSKLHNMFMFIVNPECQQGGGGGNLFTAKAAIKVMPTYLLV